MSDERVSSPEVPSKFVTISDEVTDAGDAIARFTPLGLSTFAQWLEEHFVAHDDWLDPADPEGEFTRSPEGFPLYTDAYEVEASDLADAWERAGLPRNEKGIVHARRRDALGVVYGKINAYPRFDIVKGILPYASVGLVVGASGVRKSWFAISMAASIANAQPWLGKFQTQVNHGARAVVANFDMPPSTLESWLVACGDDGKVGRCNFPRLTPDTQGFWEALEDALAPEFVVIDTLSGATPGVNERDALFSLPLKRARQYANKHEAAVLFIHHSGKEIEGPRTVANVARGTSALGGDVDVLYHLEQVKGAGPKERCSRVTCMKFRDDEKKPSPFVLQLVAGKLSIVDEASLTPSTKRPTTDVEIVLAALQTCPGQSAAAVAMATGLDPRRVRTAVQLLGVNVRTEGRGPATKLYPATPAESVHE